MLYFFLKDIISRERKVFTLSVTILSVQPNLDKIFSSKNMMIIRLVLCLVGVASTHLVK